MARIYFDSNVLSNLRRAENPKYKEMLDILNNNNEYFTFFFSYAHIQDKRKDFSEFKYLDFAFIETLVGDKHICYNPITSHAGVFIAKPIEVYNDFEKDQYFTNASNVFLNSFDYKDLREIIGKNQIYYTGEETFEFVELFKNETIQQAFVEFVKKTILIKHDGEIWYYDFYTYSYLLLDLLSIKTEKINQKNDFFNLVIDANHSYYGQYFDFFITDDKMMKTKSELLFEKYDVSTLVMNTDEFVERFKNFKYLIESNISTFFERLIKEVNSELAKIENDFTDKITFTTKEEYFRYFNEIILMKTDPNAKIHIFLNKKANNSFYMACYREIENIVNKAVDIFGKDSNGLGVFEFDREIEEMRSKAWQGRIWNGETSSIGLYINKGVKNICFEFVLPLNS